MKWYGSTGVSPRGAQVRQRCGRWLHPLSSLKTIVRPSFRAFFPGGPALLLPLLDGSLVALQGSAHRLWRAPLHLAKDLPHVPAMRADAKLVFAQVRHSITSPQRRFMAPMLWSLPQQPDQSLLVGGAEPALASRSCGLPQGRLPSCPILLPPTTHGLMANLQTASDLAMVQFLAEPPDGPPPSLL